MFPTRYWPGAYFAPRYWPKAGAAPPPPNVVLRLACTFEASPSLVCGLAATVPLSCTYEAAMSFACSANDVLALTMGVNDMPPEQLLRLIRAQDLTLRFTMDRPRSLSGWSVGFTVKTKLGGTTAVSKSVSSGVTLLDTGRGVVAVALGKADTSSLTLTSALAAGEGYIWDLKRTDSGSNVVLARGELVLEQEVTP